MDNTTNKIDGKRNPLLHMLGLVNVYIKLTKPRIAVLLLISTAAGLLAAGKGSAPIETSILVLLGGYLCAGGAASMNCYLDRDIDSKMSRTKNRPIPLGQITPRNALVFSIAISILSIPLFVAINLTVLVLGILAWLYYVLFYSMFLKRKTTQNIVIGGAAGAFPPLIGWTAITGSIDLPSIFLFLIVFFWTPPHAYALMLALREDYKKVNIPMMPVVEGDRRTIQQIIGYTIILIIVTTLPVFLNIFGYLYFMVALILGTILLSMGIRLYFTMKYSLALRLWRYSNLYLALLFVGLVLDQSIVI